MKYGKILFDLDGTLTDPKEGICRSVQYALQRFGIEEPDLDKLEPFIGPPLIDSFREFYAMEEVQAREAVEVYRERFRTIGLYENQVYPGIPELLKHVKESGSLLAVASSKPTIFVEKILKHFDLYQYFDVVVGSELDGRRTKKEDVVAEALRQLEERSTALPVTNGAENESGSLSGAVAAMVGDRKFDIEGAKAFGLVSIGVEFGYAEEGELAQAGADYIAADVPELERLLTDDSGKMQDGRAVSNEPPDGKSMSTKQPTEMPGERAHGAKEILRAVGSVFWPLFLYYLTANLVLYAFNTALAEQDRVGMWPIVNNGIAMLAGLIVISRHFVQEICCGGQKPAISTGKLLAAWLRDGCLRVRKRWKCLALTVLLGISVSIFLNLISQLLQTFVFTGGYGAYEQVAAAQYAVPFAVGVLLYGVISPLAEEAVFRGILYNRCKRYIGTLPAIFLSALLFGLFHGNLVQGIYAFVMGLLMAGLYERFHSFAVPLLFHAAANLPVFTISYYEWNQYLLQSTSIVLLNCFLFLIISFFCMFLLLKLKKV